MGYRRVLMGGMTICVLFGFSTAANGQFAEPPTEAERHELLLTPPPHRLEPTLSGDVRLGWLIPLVREELCPANAECIFKGGFALGGGVERRWPSGLGLGLAYDIWLLDSGTVYELGVMHALGGVARYHFPTRRVTHPYLGGGVAPIFMGDTFRIDATGLAVDAEVGVEIELSAPLWLKIALPLRIQTTSVFTSRADDQRRGVGGPDIILSIQLGLVVVRQ